MFTGIVESVGSVVSMERKGGLMRLSIAFPVTLTDIAAGDSIAVNGACLTVVAVGEGYFLADVSSETIKRTNLGFLRPSHAVNLERALRLGDRVGGHLVTGHIDGCGSVTEKRETGGSLLMTIRVPSELLSYLIEKGSVAVDGVSLTISALRGEQFQVTIIPYTSARTTMGDKKVGESVNIEADIIGKYVKRFLGKTEGVDEDFLSEYGFM